MIEPMLINLENLRVLSRNNKDFIREILEVYLANMPADLDRMKHALDQDEWNTVRYFAHKLKSSSFTIGFIEGHAKFQEIERSIRDGYIERVPELFDEAAELCVRSSAEVKEELVK